MPRLISEYLRNECFATLWNQTTKQRIEFFNLEILLVTSALTSGFIQAAATDVTHPLDDIVVRVVEFGLKHLQITDLKDGNKNLVRVR